MQADLLLHVVDAADPDRERHIDAVERVLTEIEAHEVPRLRVYNKVDRISDDERVRLEADPTARSSCPPPPAPASRRWSAR